MLRKIFGAKRDEVTKEWRRCHNEEFHGMYPSGKMIRVTKAGRLRCRGRVADMGKRIGSYVVLKGKLEGKKTLGRSRGRWMANIKMNLQGIKWGHRLV
jgi:hypothetical protein